MIYHLSITISGRVQGVGFRYWTVMVAQKLAVTGFIRNESNDSVYIEAEGEDDNLLKFREWLGKGPPGARVTRVRCEKVSDVKGFSSFRILY